MILLDFNKINPIIKILKLKNKIYSNLIAIKNLKNIYLKIIYLLQILSL